MALQHQVKLQHSIESDEQLEQQLCSKGLKVVEVFSEWCGPCRSVLPTFRRLRVEKDDESTLLFLTMPAEKCSYLDVAKDHRGRSEPLFLLYRNGNLKHKIYGANTPSLAQHIYELTPNNADADDLEENPLFLAMKQRLAGGGALDSKGLKKRK